MRCDVVVVGGGVAGLASAAELAAAGARVVLVEALPALGQASSARANGGVRAQFGTQINIAFSRFSIEAYEEAMGPFPQLGFHQTGYLLVTGTEAGAEALRRTAALQNEHGVATALVEPDSVPGLAPFVRPDGIAAAAYHPRDGIVDPAGVVALFDHRAREAGVSVVTDAAVTTMGRDGAGWRVVHSRGELQAEAVVNAAGADARGVALVAGGTDLPVEPVRRNLALFVDPSKERSPMVVDLDTGVLVRREAGAGWIAAYSNPEDPPGRETSLDPRFLDELAERIGNRFPFLEELPLDPGRCWAGLYPETPDHHSIVGEDPAAPGLFHAVGFGGHGIMHAPAAGRAIRELVLSGASETFDLRPLRPERFAEDDLVVEANVF